MTARLAVDHRFVDPCCRRSRIGRDDARPDRCGNAPEPALCLSSGTDPSIAIGLEAPVTAANPLEPRGLWRQSVLAAPPQTAKSP